MNVQRLSSPADGSGRSPLFCWPGGEIMHPIQQDIEARPLWKPMHLQPVFASHAAFGGDVSARLFERGLCLPTGSSLTDDDQDRVVATLLSARGT